jgi:endonuclease YncB( thermonuclease family)
VGVSIQPYWVFVGHEEETTGCHRQIMRRILLATAIISLASPLVARADPCEGRLPSRHGETFSGTVRYVGDGDSLCVGRTSNPNEWIEVRLADFDAPELREREGRRSRDILTSLSRGRLVECTATRGRRGRVVSHDRVIATCRIGGRRLGDLLRAQRAPQGGN